MRNAICLLALVLAIGCGKDPVLDARGTYDATGRWSIGGPLADGRTPGEMTADLLIEEAVALSGMPDFLEEDAREALAGAIRADVAAAVDAQMPAELEPGAPLREALGDVLAELDVESTLVLTEGGPLDGPIAGEETVTSISVLRDGVRYELLPEDLSTGAFAAEWSAEGQGIDGLDVHDHEFGIRYVALVRWVMNDVLGGSFESLEAQAASAVSCEPLSASPVTFSVSGASFTITAATLASACADVRDAALDEILGGFDYAILTVGGPVRAFDDDGDLRADRLAAESGYGGNLEIPAAPDAISPAVLVTLDATRRSH